jgi:hypothetical protein
MARDQAIVNAIDTAWTEITNANVTTISFQNIGSGIMFIRGTVGATPPAATVTDGLRYRDSEGETGKTIASLWTGAGINRVYARAQAGIIPCWVDHA